MKKRRLYFAAAFAFTIFLSFTSFSSEESEKECINNLNITSVSPEDLDQKVEEAIDETDKTITFPALPFLPETRLESAEGHEPRASDPAWDLLDTKTVINRILDGEYLAFKFDHLLNTLTVTPPADTLTAIARQAVDKAPDWLKLELEDLFARLSATNQDNYANIILNEADPYVDEVAWSIAHIAPQDLTNSSFYSQIITNNAHLLYQNDSYLDYCEIVNYGDSTSGGNYYSTIRYRVDEGGTINEYELERDNYYWFVVHPRGSDELPTYISPTPCSSSGTPSAPPNGKFWREWLFYGATNKEGGQCDNNRDGVVDGPCPVLKDELAGIQVLWAGLKNVNGSANGAVGVINDWVKRSLGSFGDKDGCRPVQPVNVYYYMDGNCGEWGDLTMAAGRAALIPTIVIDNQPNDHCWNEFWERGWHGWEATNDFIDFPFPYDDWYDDNYGGFAGCHAWRGDGWGWGPTDHYTPYCTLTVTVKDKNNYPVDGANVKVYSQFDAIPFLLGTITQSATDEKGQVKFILGDHRDFNVRVESSLGNYPSSGTVRVITSSVAGTDYTWSCTLTGGVPRLSLSPDTWPPDPSNDRLLEVSYNVNKEYLYGNGYSTGIVYNYSIFPGNIDFFIVDSANYSAFTSGGSFEAFEISLDSTSRNVSFKPPYADDWYIVFSNKATMVLTQIPEVTVKLYENNGYIPPVQNLMVTKTPEDYAHLDWEDVTGENVNGYNIYRSTTASNVGQGKTKDELAPFLIAQTTVSAYTDPNPTSVGECFYYSVRARDKNGNISD